MLVVLLLSVAQSVCVLAQTLGVERFPYKPWPRLRVLEDVDRSPRCRIERARVETDRAEPLWSDLRKNSRQIEN